MLSRGRSEASDEKEQMEAPGGTICTVYSVLSSWKAASPPRRREQTHDTTLVDDYDLY